MQGVSCVWGGGLWGFLGFKGRTAAPATPTLGS